MVKNSISATAKRKNSSAQSRLPSSPARSRKPSGTLGRKTKTHVPDKIGSHRIASPNKTIEKGFTFYANPTLALVCVPTGTSSHYSIDEAAYLTGVHAEMLRYYNRAGLIESCHGMLDTELYFDENALHEIRRIEHYRQHLGVGRRALPLICDLRREGERLQIELRFLQCP